jgi:predicted dehydrogenase
VLRHADSGDIVANGDRDVVDAVARGRIVPRPAPLGAAVVGCGYWGPNLARNLAEVTEFRLHALCDRDAGPLRALGRKHPHALLLAEFDEVLEDDAVEVAACGSCVFHEDVPETAFVTLTFASGTTANVQLSWLAPRKVRQMIVVGSKRMVQYDDTAADEPIRVYDRGMDVVPPSNFGEHQLVYRSGDVVIPRVDAQEPLRLELQDFARAIRTGEEPRSSLELGLDIVAAVEMAAASMRENGAPQARHMFAAHIAA